jgi:hypothetical protein
MKCDTFRNKQQLARYLFKSEIVFEDTYDYIKNICPIIRISFYLLFVRILECKPWSTVLRVRICFSLGKNGWKRVSS